MIKTLLLNFILSCMVTSTMSAMEEEIKRHPLINYDDPDGMSLYECCQRGCLSLKRLAIADKVAPKIEVAPKIIEITGKESLFHAVLNNKPQYVLQFILNGADVNQKDSIGWAPLHYAARDRNVVVARVLLAAPGIAIESLNGQGQTPLEIVQSRKDGMPDLHQRLCQTIIIYLEAHAQGGYPFKIVDKQLIDTRTNSTIVALS